MEIQHVSGTLRRDVHCQSLQSSTPWECSIASTADPWNSFLGNLKPNIGVECSTTHVWYPELSTGYGTSLPFTSFEVLHSQVHVLPVGQVRCRKRTQSSDDFGGPTCRQTHMTFHFRAMWTTGVVPWWRFTWVHSEPGRLSSAVATQIQDCETSVTTCGTFWKRWQVLQGSRQRFEIGQRSWKAISAMGFRDRSWGPEGIKMAIAQTKTADTNMFVVSPKQMVLRAGDRIQPASTIRRHTDLRQARIQPLLHWTLEMHSCKCHSRQRFWLRFQDGHFSLVNMVVACSSGSSSGKQQHQNGTSTSLRFVSAMTTSTFKGLSSSTRTRWLSFLCTLTIRWWLERRSTSRSFTANFPKSWNWRSIVLCNVVMMAAFSASSVSCNLWKMYLAPSSRYIHKLAEILKIHDRRGKTVPHHGCLQIYDVETTSSEEYLGAEDLKFSRSALGICTYVSQERCDIQHSVRVLVTYMARPTKTSVSAIKKFASYLIHTKDMKMFYNKVELKQAEMQRWYGGQVKTDTKPYTLDFFSDSDWAPCEVSRRSTSSGHLFEWMFDPQPLKIPDISVFEFNGGWNPCSHEPVDRSNLREAGSQFLVNDIGGLGSQRCMEMRLRLGSTSAQAFFMRLGPGRAKYLSTRLLWTQQAMRR